MGKDEKLRDRLFAVLGEKGAKLMAAGDLTGIVKDSCTVGVSVAIPLPRHVVRDLQTAPTAEYYQLYHDLNGQLDGIVEAGAAFLRYFISWRYSLPRFSIRRTVSSSVRLPSRKDSASSRMMAVSASSGS